jgi:DHA2 family multidrug resistance protein-like MFS transporter
MPSAAAEDGLPLEQRRLAVAVIAIGTVMAVLDGSITNVALPTISRELHADAASSIWVVNAYQVIVTMSILPFSSLGDAIGYRRVYAAGIALFTLGSLLCALSTSLLLLVLARVVQAVGGAAIMSIAPALNRTIFPAKMLGVAVGISALTVASSSAAGPTLGGAILAIARWPWLFAINVPIGIVNVIFALRALPVTRGSGRRVDVVSALLSGPALALFIMALDGIARRLPAAVIAGMLVASAGLGYAFVRRQSILEVPMLPLDLFRIRRFSLATGTSLLSFLAQGLAFVALPFLFQGAFGYSAFASGLLFTPWPLSIAVIAPIAGRLADRFPPPLLSTFGLGVFAAGLAALAALPAHPSAADIVWRAVVCGIGFGFFQAPNNREILGSAPRERSGGASGVLATVRLSGQSIGAAIVALVLGTSVAAGMGGAAPALAGPAHEALWLASGAAALALCVSALRLRAGHARVSEGV